MTDICSTLFQPFSHPTRMSALCLCLDWNRALQRTELSTSKCELWFVGDFWLPLNSSLRASTAPSKLHSCHLQLCLTCSSLTGQSSGNPELTGFFLLLGPGLWNEVFLQGDNQENGYLIDRASRGRKCNLKSSPLPPTSLYRLFLLVSLSFMTCFELQRGRSSSCCSSEGSSAPSRSSRKCPASSDAVAWEEDSGSIFHSGWSDHSC